MSKVSSHQRGLVAEQLIGRKLQNAGFELLEKRYRKKGGEIDIIAKSDTMLLFVETKARKKVIEYDTVLQQAQLDRICKLAEHYVISHPELANLNIRFDLFVVQEVPQQVWHFENITI